MPQEKIRILLQLAQGLCKGLQLDESLSRPFPIRDFQIGIGEDLDHSLQLLSVKMVVSVVDEAGPFSFQLIGKNGIPFQDLRVLAEVQRSFQRRNGVPDRLSPLIVDRTPVEEVSPPLFDLQSHPSLGLFRRERKLQELLVGGQKFSPQLALLALHLRQHMNELVDRLYLLVLLVAVVQEQLLPLLPQITDLLLYERENQSTFRNGISERVGQNVAGIDSILCELLHCSHGVLLEMIREQLRSQGSRKLLDDHSLRASDSDGVRLEVDLDHRYDDIVAVSPDMVALIILRVLEGRVHVQLEIGLANQNRLHMVGVFPLAFHLKPHTPWIVPGIFRCPALLLFDAPGHCLEGSGGFVPIVLPGFARGVVLRFFRQTPGDLALATINDARSDPLGYQGR
ncbi:MAG: hypothetical protein C4576_30315 [Desulfobacteraceae bacterium]|nr:MAG: hypothetical protein C4576_30315 [Desulfobacteraceae bacterium]